MNKNIKICNYMIFYKTVDNINQIPYNMVVDENSTQTCKLKTMN